MSKCKRNILLIFGFVLIVNLLFFPCNRIEYSIEFYSGSLAWGGENEVKARRWVVADYWKVFFPLIKSRANKYKEYVKWESSALLKIKEAIKPIENRLFETPLKTYTHEELYAKAKYSNSEDLFKEALKTAYTIRNEEFKEKFGHSPYYHQIIIELLFIEPVLLILFGLFGSLMLRNIRKWREDRIKRRKGGIIISLIGIGVLAVFLPLSISAKDEGGITFFAITGASLFLIGIGMVIFSFFPEDANRKK